MAVNYDTSRPIEMGSAQQSKAYLEAMAAGKDRVVYVCDQGMERSPKYCTLAQQRNEVKSTVMKDGMWGFSGALTRGKIKEKLLAQHANDHLRVIIDGNSHLQDFLLALKTSGISHEEITSGALKKEAISLGQDPDEYELNG